MAQPIKAIPTLYGEEARRFQNMADETNGQKTQKLLAQSSTLGTLAVRNAP